MICLVELLTPFTLGGRNFLISNPFLMIVSVLDVLRRGVQVLFNHQPVYLRRKNEFFFFFFIARISQKNEIKN
jgi:hypothetical protein